MDDKKLLSYTKGITRAPSDAFNSDGELAECVNLEVRNQELVPMAMPKKLDFSLSEGETLLCIHNTPSGRKNYIVLVDGTVVKSFYFSGIKIYYSLSMQISDFRSVQMLGNTVVLYTGTSPYYLLFSENDYKLLGSSIPEIEISFGLTGEIVKGEDFFVYVDNYRGNVIENMNGLPDDIVSMITSTVIAETNRFINDNSVTPGKFMYPFFVRYAYVLFDGTYTMHSAPVLMLPSTTMSPLCIHEKEGDIDLDDHGWKYNSYLAAYVAQLTMQVNSDLSLLEPWKDIVKRVDVFVSRQLYSYDQNGKVEEATSETEYEGFKSMFLGYCKDVHSSIPALSHYTNLKDAIRFAGHPEGSGYLWKLPPRDMTDLYDDICSCSHFYKYISVNIEDLSSAVVTIDNETYNANPISGIETKEVLTDDYMTHDVLIPKSTFVYNSRLNISNLERKLFKGFDVSTMTQTSYKLEIQQGIPNGLYTVYVYVKSADGSPIIVKSDAVAVVAFYGFYLFYPDSDAYKMVIVDSLNNRYAEVELVEHTMLNGAFAFFSFSPVSFVSGNPSISETNNTEILPNRLFTSEVNNVWHFPLEGVNTVGAGEIIGLVSVTRPISTGQFGEYPLMAFCTDGNFALKVDSQGYYATVSPIQEDLILGQDKITSMEDSAMVITKKGVMVTDAFSMNHIIAQMEGEAIANSTLSGLITGNASFDYIIEATDDTEGFLTYLYGARIAYDYASNRAVIYNKDRRFAFVYSFDNGTVTKMCLLNGGIVNHVLDYPDVVLEDENGWLYSLYEKEDINQSDMQQYGFACTRPLRLGAALSVKSIQRLKNIYSKTNESSYVKYSIFGSNDEIHYMKLSSLRSKAYKYYRIAFYTHLLPKEAFTGTAMVLQERRSLHKFK